MIIIPTLKKQQSTQELSVELKDSIAIAESGGCKVSDFTIDALQRVEAGELTHKQARELIIEHYCI